jgi:hypothetical protein
LKHIDVIARARHVKERMPNPCDLLVGNDVKNNSRVILVSIELSMSPCQVAG